MREKKPSLVFAISNSPVASIDGKDSIGSHEYCNASEEDLRKWIKRFGTYKVIGSFPKEPLLFVGKYDGDKLEICRTKRHYDPDPRYPHRFKMTEVVSSEYLAPIAKNHSGILFAKVNTEIFYGPPIENDDPWNVFKRLAWFQDICSAMPAMMNRDEKEIRSVIEWAVFHGGAKVMLEHFEDEIPGFLRTVRDDPDALRNSDVLEAYIDYRKCMRGDYGRNEAKKMKDLFGSFGIPKKNDADARKQEIARSLMTILTDHLNDVCRKNSGVSIKAGNNSRKEIAPDKYNSLIQWATQNNEARVAALSQAHISSLLFNTEPFINTLLPKGFGVSPKTLYRKSAH